MATDPIDPPRNRDQEQPRRKGEAIESTGTTERDEGERKRNAPVPEEETYEREPRNQRPR